MSLKSIRAKVAAKLSFNPTDTDLRTLVDSYINEAAFELWHTFDLVGSLKEEIIWFEGPTKQIALPSYVLVVRGLRYYNSQYNIPLNDMRPRYLTQGFGQESLNFREKGKYPLHTEIENESILKFTIPVEETAAISITVIGKTPSSSKISETVVIPVGSREVITTNIWKSGGLHSISKDASNVYNIKVLDADDTELAEIPNSELNSKYTIIQVLDDNIEQVNQQSGIEVLYKPVFRPFLNDNDEFQAEGYDDAIFWKTMEIYNGRQDDDNAGGRAYGCQQKCKEILDIIAGNNSSGKRMIMDFKPNPMYGLFRPSHFLGTKFRT